RVADEHAALRRVATLVARGGRPRMGGEAVTEEGRAVFGADATLIVRLDSDGDASIVAHAGAHLAETAVGSRWRLEPPLASAEAVETGRPARLDDFSGAERGLAEVARRTGVVSSVASPIVVAGRIWGAIAIVAERAVFARGTERRLVEFTE